jgi:hypothetical protein
VWDLNDQAYAELMLSINTSTTAGKVTFNYVKAGKTKDFPEGNAAESWRRLRQKYRPDSAPMLTKLTKQFYASKMDDGQDPDEWMTQLEDIQIQMSTLGSEMTDGQFIMKIMNNLPSDYDNIIDILGNRLSFELDDEKNNDRLTIEELREELSLKYERMQERKKMTNSGGGSEDTALYAGGKFKGKCHHCGKYGHKSTRCWEKDPSKKPSGGRNNNHNNKSTDNKSGNNSTSRFNGKCNYCQIIGHREKDCRKKRRDQGNGRDNKTVAAVTTECE